MNRSTSHSVRLERITKDYINEACENLDAYNSIKHFSERAVANHAGYLEQEVRGAADLKRLIQALCRVDEIDIGFSKESFNTKIADQRFTTTTRVELDPAELKPVDEISRSTEMSKGDAIRACIIRELYEISSSDELLHEPRQSDIEQSWSSISSNIDELYSTILAKLETRLVAQWESTQSALEADQKARDALVSHYQNYFKDSVGYERLQESEFGEEMLSNLEALPHGTG